MGRWTFGEFALDAGARQLLRSGKPLPLSPKAFRLLEILVENQPRALSKSELQDCLWPGTFVVEKNLTNLVAEIREVLGDDPAHAQFIRTVPRFGYAFCGALAADTNVEAAPSHNLPEPLTTFVGRTREIDEVCGLLSSTRLMTLTGAGGCGKTRLAIEAARRMLTSFEDGVWIVDLGPLSDASLVPQTAAAVLQVRPAQHRTLLEALCDYCRRRQLLLVLDNCEHLIGGCAELAEALLHAAPRLSILATSREALGIAGERIWRVPSLADSEAVELFVSRATAVVPAFNTIEAAPTIVEVCRRLDCIPLAIELAAARLKVLSLDQINARLNDRFRLLTGGSRTALSRQRTLEAAVAWSYELLSETERRLLRRLSVFAGRWTLEASEQVCSGEGIARFEILDLVSRLVDKSLVVVDDAGGERRYRFLETVRQYARERLVESSETERMRDRHLAFFVDLVRSAEPELNRGDQVAWLERLQAEHDNLRLALEWGLATPSAAVDALELASAFFFYWLKRAYFAEGQQWLERALAGAHTAPAAPRAKALNALGNMTFFQGDFTRTRALLAESAALARTAGDRQVLAMALGVGGIAELQLGQVDAAERLASEARAVGQQTDMPWLQGPALSALAYVALQRGDPDEAGRLHEEELALFREQGELWGMTIVLFDLALLRVVQHRLPEARALCAEGARLCQEFGDQRGIAWSYGLVAAAEAAEGRFLRAARLRGAMEGLLERVGAPVQPLYEKWLGQRYLPAVRESLGEEQFQAALSEGRAMTYIERVSVDPSDWTA